MRVQGIRQASDCRSSRSEDAGGRLSFVSFNPRLKSWISEAGILLRKMLWQFLEVPLTHGVDMSSIRDHAIAVKKT